VSSFCRSALASLDDSCALLHESLEKFKAAQSVNTTEAIEQLKMAAASARQVREWVRSELPQASWQTREELDELVDEIQKIVIARALEQLRSRLLALATELERGTIVHRRAIRVGELNRLREQAVNELRTQAKSEAPATLPGPPADHWLVWACGLQEAQDAEPLQALHNGYPQLDDFVANLELSMWVAGPATEETPEAKRSADTTQPEPPWRAANGYEESVGSPVPPQLEWKAPKSTAGHDEPRSPDLPDAPRPPGFECNTLTPLDVTPPRTEEQIQEMRAQELALLEGLMGWITDPVGHLNATVERAATPKVARDASATAVADATEPVGDFSSSVQPPLPAQVPRESSSAQAIPSKTGTKVRRLGSGKLRMLIVLTVGLGLASLGTILWRSERSYPPNQPIMIANNSPVKTFEQKIPERAGGNPEPKPISLVAITSDSGTRANGTRAASKEPPKLPKQQKERVTANSLSKVESARQANGRTDELSRTPREVSGSITPVAKQGPQPPPGNAAGTPNLIPPVLPNLLANNVPNVVADIPVAARTVANERLKVSSGVAQGSLIHQVNPRYPQQAVQARVEGTVVLQAVIGKDGSVQDLHALSGSPLLIQPAMDAVKQWRYKPYRLNGEPVEAETQVNVKFTLNK
jgi:protein TonB